MLKHLKKKIKNVPVLDKVITNIRQSLLPSQRFLSSTVYWENRYKKGGNSGAGSYNNLAEYKGEIINTFVSDHKIESVIEFGCGDGNQLKYFSFKSYVGCDVSRTVIDKCSRIFKNDTSKKFVVLGNFKPIKAELTLSLDVIYHLVEDEVFNDHMCKLFDSSEKYVVIYSSNSDNHENNGIAKHVKHRNFTNWIEINRPEFKLLQHIPNKYAYNGDGSRTSYADFYFFEKE